MRLTFSWTVCRLSYKEFYYDFTTLFVHRHGWKIICFTFKINQNNVVYPQLPLTRDHRPVETGAALPPPHPRPTNPFHRHRPQLPGYQARKGREVNFFIISRSNSPSGAAQTVPGIPRSDRFQKLSSPCLSTNNFVFFLFPMNNTGAESKTSSEKCFSEF